VTRTDTPGERAGRTLFERLTPARAADLAARHAAEALTDAEKLALAVLHDPRDEAVAMLADAVTELNTAGHRVPVRVVAHPERTVFVMRQHTAAFSQDQIDRMGARLRAALAAGGGQLIVLPPFTSLEAFEVAGDPDDFAAAGDERVVLRPARSLRVDCGDVTVHATGGAAPSGTAVIVDGVEQAHLTAVRIDLAVNRRPTVTLTRSVAAGK
jgi:hypothetical protein